MAQPEFQVVVAQAPRKKLKFIAQSQTSAVAAGATQNIDIYSPIGTYSKVIAMYLEALIPAGATSGTHQFSFQNGSAGPHFLRGLSNFNEGMMYDYSHFGSPTISIPASDEAIGNAAREMYFDSVLSLRISYINSTNAAQNGTRTIILTVEETTLAS